MPLKLPQSSWMASSRPLFWLWTVPQSRAGPITKTNGNVFTRALMRAVQVPRGTPNLCLRVYLFYTLHSCPRWKLLWDIYYRFVLWYFSYINLCYTYIYLNTFIHIFPLKLSIFCFGITYFNICGIYLVFDYLFPKKVTSKPFDIVNLFFLKRIQYPILVT